MKNLVCQITLIVIFGSIVRGDSVSGTEEVESFTEPYRSVDVPAAEIGVLSEILVQEGDLVRQSQLLAKLDDEVLRRSLEVARVAKDATGSLNAAQSELDSRTQQLNRFQTLRRNDNATDRELQRAISSVQLAEAKVQIVRDELEVRRMEFERTRSQLKKRSIVAPISGVVTMIHRDAGEFVSPTDPIVLSIVELSRLKAVFSVPRSAAVRIPVGSSVQVLIEPESSPASGTVEFVSPTTDPQSGTVRVKVRIDNSSGKLPCGTMCRWDLRSSEPERQASRVYIGKSR